MKKAYKISYTKTECYIAVVEAESLEQAIELAEEEEGVYTNIEPVDGTLTITLDIETTKENNNND